MRIGILYFLAIFICSCSDNFEPKVYNRKLLEVKMETDNVQPLARQPFKGLTFDLDGSNNDTFDIVDLVDSVEYLKLETNKTSLVGQISKIIVLENGYLIVDRDISKSVFYFGLDGKFISKISAFGDGQKQYKSISDIEYDPSKKQVIIYDNEVGSFLHFDLSGNFTKRTELGFRMKNFFIFSDGRFIAFTGNVLNDHLPIIENSSLLLLPEHNKVSYEGFRIKPQYKDLSIWAKDHLTRNNNLCYFFPRFSDTVYCINSTGDIQPLYAFKNSRRVSDSFLDEEINRKMFISKSNTSGLCYFVGNFYENSTHLYSAVSDSRSAGGSVTVLCDKGSKNVRKISQVINRFKRPELLQLSLPLSVKGDRFLSVLSSDLVVAYKKIYDQPYTKPKTMPESFRQLLSRYQPKDNPTLVFYTLKRF